MKCESKLSDNKILGLIILGIIIFFTFILPIIDNKNKQCIDEINEKLTNITNITNTPKLDTNICSKQCCNHTQWPVPDDVKTKEISDKDMEKYIGTNLSCNFGSGSGCLCVTKDDFKYLANRGSNAGKDMCGYNN
jgi:hypothetical protein